MKKGKLRFYPYNINWNYGLLPQTWEDPAKKDHQLDCSVSSGCVTLCVCVCARVRVWVGA